MKQIRKSASSSGATVTLFLVFLAAGLLSAHGPLSEEPVSARTVEKAALPGERETLALAKAYPDQILGREIRGGQWAVRIGDQWFYWADGRLLKAEKVDRRNDFVPIRFYSYYRGPRREHRPTPEQLQTTRARSLTGNVDPRPRSNYFLDSLYGFSSRAEADRAMVEARFLGKRIRVHPLLVQPLARAEQTIRKAEASDPALRNFVRGIAYIQGFHWREIAGTNRRSYHSYGAAIDIVPRSYGGRFAYWRWAHAAGVEEWWTLPNERIWIVPQAFVNAMEDEGFVWGGKWLWFDTIHFEYRPEVLLMTK